MKLITLINAQGILPKILTLDLEITKAFELSKFIKKADEELKIFNELRESLIKKYWEELWEWEDMQIKVKEENIEKFNIEINKLSEKEIELIIPKLEPSDFSWGKIDTSSLLQLDFLFNNIT